MNVGNEPVVLIGSPLSARLNLHVLHRRDELVDDQVLEPDLARQLANSVHEVLALAVDHLRDVIQLILSHAEAGLHSRHLLIDLLELLLLRREVLSQLQLHSLLGLQVLLHGELLASALLKLSLALEQLLLLLHGLLHFFVTAQQLLFHILDLLQQLLLLALLFLLSFLLDFQVGQ